jgi:hypothetical protein
MDNVVTEVTLQNIGYICGQLCSVLPCSLLVHFASIGQGNVTEGQIIFQELFLSIVSALYIVVQKPSSLKSM